MSLHPELRFHCDRCHSEVVQPYQNTPSDYRAPASWMILKINNEDHSRHLCTKCTEDFDTFMKGVTNGHAS